MFINYMKGTNSITHAGQENPAPHIALSEQPMKSSRRETFQLNTGGFACVELEPAALWAECKPACATAPSAHKCEFCHSVHKHQLWLFTFFLGLPHHLPFLLRWSCSQHCTFLKRALNSDGAGHYWVKGYSKHRRVCCLLISRAEFFTSFQLCT